VVADRYELVAPLGSGAMGTVWAGVDLLLDRQVAVKEVALPRHVTDREMRKLRKRMLREARMAARLSHPNAVAVYDVTEEASRAWIVMALVQARSLHDLVHQDGPLTPQQAAMVGLQVLAALRAAHQQGIVHRDVKPGNVLIGSDGHAVLADFGIARSLDGSTLTTAGTVVGSPAYIAPERARGERGGPASDLWSLGATLYTAVEGRPPYDRGGAVETLTAVVTQDPDPPHRAGPLWPAISGLLRGDRELRLDAAAAEQMLLTVAGTPEALPPAAALTSPAGPAAGPGATVGHRTDPTVTLTRGEPARPLHPASGQDAPAARPEGSAPATQPLPPPPHPARRRRRSWTIVAVAALVIVVAGVLLALMLFSGSLH
jgi:eukaryotic-like serine/threonine-protein kinase